MAEALQVVDVIRFPYQRIMLQSGGSELEIVNLFLRNHVFCATE